MKTGSKRASVGVLGLPLIAALAALFIAAFVAFSFARAGPVSAANEVGISASDATSGDPANVVQDDGITALQPDTATVVATEPGNGILDYSAIPIDTTGINWLFFLVTSIGATLVVATTIGFRMTERRRRSEITTDAIDGPTARAPTSDTDNNDGRNRKQKATDQGRVPQAPTLTSMVVLQASLGS